jgi:hypothetical protein
MLFPMLNVLYCDTSTSHSVCAVPNVAVCYSSLLCFPGVLLRCFLNGFQMVVVAPLYYWYNLCSYVPHTLYFCCKVFIF